MKSRKLLPRTLAFLAFLALPAFALAADWPHLSIRLESKVTGEPEGNGLVITSQPVGGLADYGFAFLVSVIAESPEPIAYQWEGSTDGLSWVALTGATSASFEVLPKLEETSTWLRCQLVSGAETLVSDAVEVMLNQSHTYGPFKANTWYAFANLPDVYNAFSTTGITYRALLVDAYQIPVHKVELEVVALTSFPWGTISDNNSFMSISGTKRGFYWTRYSGTNSMRATWWGSAGGGSGDTLGVSNPLPSGTYWLHNGLGVSPVGNSNAGTYTVEDNYCRAVSHALEMGTGVARFYLHD